MSKATCQHRPELHHNQTKQHRIDIYNGKKSRKDIAYRRGLDKNGVIPLGVQCAERVEAAVVGV